MVCSTKYNVLKGNFVAQEKEMKNMLGKENEMNWNIMRLEKKNFCTKTRRRKQMM